MYRNVSPKDASRLMAEEDYVFVDVRSEQEFESGHPVGARNVPLMHLRPGVGMTPNPRFVEVMEANFSKDTRLVLGCRSGARSARACQLLATAGYRDLVNLDGGLEGGHDAMRGITRAGWEQEGLPSTTDAPEGTSYGELAAKA